jgi:hypothetical protein
MGLAVERRVSLLLLPLASKGVLTPVPALTPTVYSPPLLAVRQVRAAYLEPLLVAVVLDFLVGQVIMHIVPRTLQVVLDGQLSDGLG